MGQLKKIDQFTDLMTPANNQNFKTFQKPFDIPTHFFITENPTLRKYQELESVTEVDPEYYLMWEQLPIQDEFDPQQTDDLDLLKQKFLATTPGLNSINAINSLPLEAPYYIEKRLQLPYGNRPEKASPIA